MALSIKQNISLKPYNTFGIEVLARLFTTIQSIDDFKALVKERAYLENEKLIIGGGSNILFTKNVDGLVIKNELKGINIVFEDGEWAHVKVAAGEVWHDFVMWSIEHGLAGLENLSLIPGCVGASPMQNIGAYGVEIKECFVELEACSLNDASLKTFSNADCRFGYRESVFKHELKNKYLITSVTYRLCKKPKLNTSYGAISAELKAMNISSPGIKDVSNAVINIRKSKLPDPEVTGNAGSFFKNPEVSAEKHGELVARFPNLVAYPLPDGRFKLAAGWLIEQCGLQGFEMNGAAVHDRQALVLVNKGHCLGKDVYDLSSYVLQKVSEKFGVTLEREVNII